MSVEVKVLSASQHCPGKSTARAPQASRTVTTSHDEDVGLDFLKQYARNSNVDMAVSYFIVHVQICNSSTVL